MEYSFKVTRATEKAVNDTRVNLLIKDYKNKKRYFLREITLPNERFLCEGYPFKDFDVTFFVAKNCYQKDF